MDWLKSGEDARSSSTAIDRIIFLFLDDIELKGIDRNGIEKAIFSIFLSPQVFCFPPGECTYSQGHSSLSSRSSRWKRPSPRRLIITIPANIRV